MTCTSGQYWSSTLQRCIECSANCVSCDGKKFCEECEAPYTLMSTNVCKCSGFTNRFGDCIVCETDTMFYDGDVCQDCDSNCATCSSPFGVCTSC